MKIIQFPLVLFCTWVFYSSMKPATMSSKQFINAVLKFQVVYFAERRYSQGTVYSGGCCYSNEHGRYIPELTGGASGANWEQTQLYSWNNSSKRATHFQKVLSKLEEKTHPYHCHTPHKGLCNVSFYTRKQTATHRNLSCCRSLGVFSV